jgi:transcriptional regulator
MKINKEILKGSSEIIILKILEKEPLYGYKISKEIRKNSSDIFSLGEGTLYPVLHKLEKNKMLQSYWQEYEGRRRKYYTITKKGKKLLDEKTAEWKVFSKALNLIVEA